MNQIGTLKVSTMPTAVYTLKLGPNIIGRDVKSSKADWKIPGTDSCMRISREHIIVEVKNLSNGSYRHELSLYKDKVNATYVNGDRVEDKEERLILNQGDSVKLPDNIMLLFEIPDTDGTLKDLSLY